jgi:hypothetical protein
MGGQLSVVFAAGRIEVAWALAALRQEDRAEARQPTGDHHLQPGPGDAMTFLTALEAVLEVLPLSARYTGFDPVKAAGAGAGGTGRGLIQ